MEVGADAIGNLSMVLDPAHTRTHIHTGMHTYRPQTHTPDTQNKYTPRFVCGRSHVNICTHTHTHLSGPLELRRSRARSWNLIEVSRNLLSSLTLSFADSGSACMRGGSSSFEAVLGGLLWRPAICKHASEGRDSAGRGKADRAMDTISTPQVYPLWGMQTLLPNSKEMRAEMACVRQRQGSAGSRAARKTRAPPTASAPHRIHNNN